jgi:outer membrane protein assembly factor BamC
MWRKSVCLLVISIGLPSCGMLPNLDRVLPDNRKEYRESETLPDLEVPPDLATVRMRDSMAVPEPGNPESTSYAAYQKRLEGRRQQGKIERLEDKGITAGLLESERALTLQGTPFALWPQLERFWSTRGYTLDLNDRELGVMETAWREDSEALARDRYKLFVEQGEQAGTTVIYVSQSRETMIPSGEELVWRKAGFNEQQLNQVTENLRLAVLGEAATGAVAAVPPGGAAADTMTSSQDFALHDGSADAAAREAIADKPAILVSAGEGKVFLNVRQDFAEAWSATGKALDQAGARVEDEDRDRGVYYVFFGGDRKKNKKGLFSRLAFWKDDYNYQVSLTGVGNKTEVVILDHDGQWDTGEEAGELLSRLEAEINRLLSVGASAS